MQKLKRGRSISLTAHRVMVCDLLHFSRKIPSIPVQRRMRLGPLVAAREKSSMRPSWVSLFTYSFAKVAAVMPELRRSYIPFPWPRLYEHPFSIASVAVERKYHGEPALFFAMLCQPEGHRLEAVHRYIRWFTGLPQKNMKAARIALRMKWLWWPLRHLVWHCILNVSGFLRAWSFGTFSVSVYSALGAESLHPLSPVAFVLNYGPIDEKGEVDVRIVYDHRVLDGATVARALAVWEAELTGPIIHELFNHHAAHPPQV